MRAGLLAVLLAGCFESKAPPCTVDCSSDAECPSGLSCNGTKCSVGGAVCEAVSCALGETRCSAGGGSLEVCDAAGAWTSSPCATSCVSTGPAPHCQHVVPVVTVLDGVCDEPAAAATWTAPSSFPTGMSQACTQIVAQVDGPEICLVRAKEIVLPSSTTMKVTGPRALALVADAKLDIAGSIDLSAASIDPDYGSGPGGGDQRVSGLAPDAEKGGSGAGFQTSGASGGSPGTPLGGGPSNDDVLHGRLAGGFRAAGSQGGGGGGAVALLSCTDQASVTGLVEAAGGGGGGGLAAGAGTVASGWGGGSGGTVLIQGMQVVVGGRLFANGGAGGGGTTDANNGGGRGGGGSRSVSVSAGGGTPEGVGAGAGGDGGTRNRAPAPGLGGAAASGGGGGSVGYIILVTPAGVNATVSSGELSPGPLKLIATVR